MNPFLHDTVGRPARDPHEQPAVPPCRLPGAAACNAARPGDNQQPSAHAPRPSARLRPRRQSRSTAYRLARLLAAAGAATLTWVGSAGAVDLNSATLEALQGIRGIGPKTAQIILEERARGGRYLSFSDLSDRVRGIGPRRAQALQSAGLTIDGGGTRLSGQGAEAQAAAAASTGKPARSPEARKR